VTAFISQCGPSTAVYPAHTIEGFISSLSLLCSAILCSWSTAWGLNGTSKSDYGAAYNMQPDHTFAMRFLKTPNIFRVQDIISKMKPNLAYDTARQGCVLYTPQTPERLVAVADALAAVDDTAQESIGQARIFADVVASNLGPKHLPNLSAASRGPFRLCGRVAQVLKDVLPSGPAPVPSPSPRPQPSPSPSPTWWVWMLSACMQVLY
jgi:hypothetical protein